MCCAHLACAHSLTLLCCVLACWLPVCRMLLLRTAGTCPLTPLVVRMLSSWGRGASGLMTGLWSGELEEGVLAAAAQGCDFTPCGMLVCRVAMQMRCWRYRLSLTLLTSSLHALVCLCLLCVCCTGVSLSGLWMMRSLLMSSHAHERYAHVLFVFLQLS